MHPSDLVIERPSAPLPLLVHKRPFSAPEILPRPEGLSIDELVDTAPLDPVARRHLVVLLGDEAVPRALWVRIRPKAGAMLTLAIRPSGEETGTKILRTVLQIAVLVGSYFVGVTFGPFAAAAFAVLGNWAINALLPPPKVRTPERPAPTFSIDGQRNEARPWEPVALVLGNVRVMPKLLALPIQEIAGDDVYLRMAVTWGPAPVQLDDIRIGETPISQYQDLEIEHRLAASDPAHLLMQGDTFQEAVGGVLTQTFTSRTTQASTDEIAVILTWPGGLGGFDSRNRKIAREVTFEIDWRPAGVAGAPWRTQRPGFAEGEIGGRDYDDLWTIGNINGEITRFTGALPGGTPSGPVTVRRADPGRPVRHVIRWVVPRSQYEVRVRRTTPTSTDNSAIDEVQWSVLESKVRGADAFPNRQLASTVLRIKATEQLSGIIDTLNARVTRIAPVLNAGVAPDDASAATWQGLAATRNPADNALWLVRGPHVPRPIPDDEIDWPAWAAFRQHCITHGFAIDLEIGDRIRRQEALDLVCGAARAKARRIAGRLTVVIDAPRPFPVQLLTPRNTLGLRVTRAALPRTQGLRVAFANRERGFRQDERLVLIDGVSAETVTEVEAVDAPGITDPAHVWKWARHLLATRALQLESATCEQDVETLAAPFGSLVQVAHDQLGQTGAQARVVDLILNAGGQVTGLLLDQEVLLPAAALAPGQSWVARWRRIAERSPGEWAADVQPLLNLDAQAGDGVLSREVLLASPLSPSAAPGPTDLLAIGITSRESVPMLVAGVSPGDDMGARVTLVAYAPERYTWSAGPAPAFVSLLGPDTLAPDAPTITESFVDAEGAKARFTVPDDRGFQRTLVRWRDTPPVGEQGSWETAADLSAAARLVVVPAPSGARRRDIELTLVDLDGRRSPPALVLAIGSALPETPQGLSVTPIPGGLAFVVTARTDFPSQLVVYQTRPQDPANGVWQTQATAVPDAPGAFATGLPVVPHEVRALAQSRDGVLSLPTDILVVTPSAIGSALLTLSRQVINIQADAAGNVLANQLPAFVNVTRLRGGENVSAFTTWSIAAASGCAVVIGTTGVAEVTAVTGSGGFTVRSVIDGVTIDGHVTLTKVLAAPPSGGSNGGTAASNTSFQTISTTSFVPLSAELALRTGTGGVLTLTAAFETIAVPATFVGTYEIEAKWQTRLSSGGSWADAGSAAASNPDATTFGEDDGLGSVWPSGEAGALSVAASASLAPSTDYLARLVARRTSASPVRVVSVSGVASAVGS